MGLTTAEVFVTGLHLWIAPVAFRLLPSISQGLAREVHKGLGCCLYLRRRLGGHSGDLLGTGNQRVEAAPLPPQFPVDRPGSG